MRRALRITALVLFAVGLVLALMPFDRPGPSGLTRPDGAQLSDRCAPPIISAWRTDHAGGGWFGYAVSTSSPRNFAAPMCHPTARDRVELATGLWIVAALLVTLRHRPRRLPHRVAAA